jgi:hypothetical protein
MTTSSFKVWLLIMKGPEFFVAVSAHRTISGAQAKAQSRISEEEPLLWDQVGEESWETRTNPDWLYQIYPRVLMD